jgi:hypothetical protein
MHAQQNVKNKTELGYVTLKYKLESLKEKDHLGITRVNGREILNRKVLK